MTFKNPPMAYLNPHIWALSNFGNPITLYSLTQVNDVNRIVRRCRIGRITLKAK